MTQKARTAKSFSSKGLSKLILILLAIFVFAKPVMRYFYPVNFLPEIKIYSEKYSLAPELVMALIDTESGFDKDAVSQKDAIGLMQLKEDTAKWCIKEFSIDRRGRALNDPDLNIETGCAYLSYLMEKFAHNTHTALASYNAGEGNVIKWLGGADSFELKSIPFKETRRYVNSVQKRVRIYRFLY